MKSRSFFSMSVAALVGALLAVWLLPDREPPLVGLAPQNVPEIILENVPTPSKEDEAARLERERLERERRIAERRQALHRTADAFLDEAAAVVNENAYIGERPETLRKIVLAQMRADDFVGARATVVAMEDAYVQADLLRWIMWNQVKSGDQAEGRKTFQLWSELIAARGKNAVGKSALSGRLTVARAQMAVGDREGAVALLRAALPLVKKGSGRRGNNASLRELAQAQSKVGDVAGLKETLAVATPGKRDNPARLIAEAQIKAGDIVAAKATVATMKSMKGHLGYTRDIWEDIIRAQVRAGDVAGAMATAQVTTFEDDSNASLMYLALEQRKIGDLAAATVTAAMIEHLAKRDRVLTEIMEGYIKARDFASAGEAAAMIEFAESHARACHALAVAQGTAAAFADAREAAVAVEKPGARAGACLAVAKAQIAAGDRAGLGALLEVIEPAAAEMGRSYYCFMAIRYDFARVCAAAGSVPAAMKTLRETVAFAATVKYVSRNGGEPSPDKLLRYGERRDALRVTCGGLQAGIGDFAGAMATLDVTEGAPARAMLLLKIAEAKRVAGDAAAAATMVADAMAATASIGDDSPGTKSVWGGTTTGHYLTDPEGVAKRFADAEVPIGRKMLYVEVAKMQAKLGDVTGALAIAAKLGKSHEATQAYWFIAMVQVEAGDVTGALVTVKEIKNAETRASALAAMATTLARADDFAAARAWAAKPYGLAHRAQASQNIAQVYGERGNAADILAWARQEGAAQCRINILLGGAKGLRIMAGSADPSFVPPVAVSENVPEGQPALPNAAELARLERERKAAECREVLRRAADTFLGEAAAVALQAEHMDDRAGQLYNIALAQMRAGDCVAARTAALAMASGGKQTDVLRYIFTAQAENGEFAEGRETFRLWYAARLAQNKSLEENIGWWEMIARMQSELESRDAAAAALGRAVALARKIKSKSKRNAKLLDLAGAQAYLGDVDGVRATLAARQPGKRDNIARIIARAQLNAGDFAAAKATVATMKSLRGDLAYTQNIWQEIIEAQARTGDFDGAMATVRMSKFTEDPSAAWMCLALKQCKMGDFVAARASGAWIRHPAKRLRVLGEINKGHLAAQDFETVRAIAATIEYAEERAKAFRLLAVAQGSAEAFAQAREAAVVVERPGARAAACLAVAQAQIAAGDRAGLDMLLKVIEPAVAAIDRTHFYHDQVRRAFITFIPEVGDVPAAKKMLREAAASVVDLKYVIRGGRKPKADDLLRCVERRDFLRLTCGGQQAGIGDFAGALATLEGMESAAGRATLLLRIAEVKHTAGDAPGAAKMVADATAAAALAGSLSKQAQYDKRMAGTYRSWGQPARAAKLLLDAAVPLTRDMLYVEIAGLHARMGHAAAAKDTVPKIENSRKIIEACALIAVTQVKAGDVTAALATVSEIREARIRTSVRTAVATALAEAGNFPAARTLADESDTDTHRAQACENIAQVHGERGDAAAIRQWAQQEDAYCRIKILLGGAKGLRIMAKSVAPTFVAPVPE